MSAGEVVPPPEILSGDQWRGAMDAIIDGPDPGCGYDPSAYLALEEHDAALRARVEQTERERDRQKEGRGASDVMVEIQRAVAGGVRHAGDAE